jgi:hypothetical protein
MYANRPPIRNTNPTAYGGNYFNSEKFGTAPGTVPTAGNIPAYNVGLPPGATGNYYLSESGQQPTTQTAQAPLLQPGQFINPAGTVQQGATPFGTNAFGQRLDASGNVWDPATATRDIYGGRFIQVGEKRWERVNGKLRQVVYGKGGKKTVVKGRGGGGGDGGSYQQQPATPAQAEQRTFTTTQFVSFRA